MSAIADEMPARWVRALVDAIERLGWTVADAHESAIVIDLTPQAATVLHADDGDRLVIGWAGGGATEGETHWGLSSDGVHVPALDGLGGDTPATIAARVDRLLRTGRPEPRDIRHAVPYVDPGEHCRCPAAHPCRGIIPDSDCPEHGARRAPAMAWHWEADCAAERGERP